ncbi:hypothetical protein C8J56DRAFT_1026356 [Mycena floridula]|nr:hypothetical protein C8J56DRAFT_1026356 [Mycena floridula]
MDRILSYLRSYWPFFNLKTESSSSTTTMSASNVRIWFSYRWRSLYSLQSADSNLSSGFSQPSEPKVIDSLKTTETTSFVPYSNWEKMFTSLMGRLIKSERVPLPGNWHDDWSKWEYSSELYGPFECSDLQIYLEVKYELVFQEVQLLMFLPDMEVLVFRYRNKYYRYEMENAELFVCPDTFDSVDSFLEEWDEIEGMADWIVSLGGTDQECIDIINDEAEEAMGF